MVGEERRGEHEARMEKGIGWRARDSILRERGSYSEAEMSLNRD